MTGEEGQLLKGRYRLVRALESDSAFMRWLAVDIELDSEEVEVVLFPEAVVSSRRAFDSVRDAAIASLKLLHTNIASTRAFDENGGSPFMVFDHVDGRPLSACLDEWGKLSEGETKALLEPLAGALDYAHGKGVIHEDVRPSNVIVDNSAVPYVVGFRVAREAREALARTEGGNAAGPISWMSPEQLLGKPPAKEQDIYSFAAIAYECLSGHPPFSRGQIEYQILNCEPERLQPETPFTRAVMRALSKDPSARPASCSDIIAGDHGRIDIPDVVEAVPVKVAKARPGASRSSSVGQPPVASPARRVPVPEPVAQIQAVNQPANVVQLPGAVPPGRVMSGDGRLPPLPPKARRPDPPKRIADMMTEEERRAAKERRNRRLAEVERRRSRRHASSYMAPDDITVTPARDAGLPPPLQKAAPRQAIWLLAAIGIVAVAVIVFVSLGGRKRNVELANAPAKREFTAAELGRFSHFHDIEFGMVVPRGIKPGDTIVFGSSTNTISSVSLDGKFFEVQLDQPVFKVFPSVRVSLVDTDGGRRISALTFERDGEVVKAAKASKVVTWLASSMEKEYGIDMGDAQTAINNSYFGRRYSDDFIDIRISSVVSPDSTSISFSIENRAVRAMETVALR